MTQLHQVVPKPDDRDESGELSCSGPTVTAVWPAAWVWVTTVRGSRPRRRGVGWADRGRLTACPTDSPRTVGGGRSAWVRRVLLIGIGEHRLRLFEAVGLVDVLGRGGWPRLITAYSGVGWLFLFESVRFRDRGARVVVITAGHGGSSCS